MCRSVMAGVPYVVAAGNSGVDFQSDAADADYVPATYDFALTVTAIADFDGKPGSLFTGASCWADGDDSSADFSNWTDATKSREVAHTIAAPGKCIYSTAMGGGYTTKSGTSMASPHVAGVAALCMAAGKCSGGPMAIMDKLRTDATARDASYGFLDDPYRPNETRHYGYLVYAGGY